MADPAEREQTLANLAKGREAFGLGSRHTDETRAKMRDAKARRREARYA